MCIRDRVAGDGGYRNATVVTYRRRGLFPNFFGISRYFFVSSLFLKSFASSKHDSRFIRACLFCSTVNRYRLMVTSVVCVCVCVWMVDLIRCKYYTMMETLFRFCVRCKNIRTYTAILWRVFGILTEPVPYTFGYVNRRNDEARAHVENSPQKNSWIYGYF